MTDDEIDLPDADLIERLEQIWAETTSLIETKGIADDGDNDR